MLFSKHVDKNLFLFGPADISVDFLPLLDSCSVSDRPFSVVYLSHYQLPSMLIVIKCVIDMNEN